jgi:hypothetical protein
LLLNYGLGQRFHACHNLFPGQISDKEGILFEAFPLLLHGFIRLYGRKDISEVWNLNRGISLIACGKKVSITTSVR